MSTKPVKKIIAILVIACAVLCVFLLNRTHTPAGATPRENSRIQKRATRTPGESRQTRPQDTLTEFQNTEVYRVIRDNNLFRPLGWTPPRPRDPYRLIGTILPKDDTAPRRAILESTGTTFHTVGIGETLGNRYTLTDIQPKQVTLEKDGKMLTLRLKNDPWLK